MLAKEFVRAASFKNNVEYISLKGYKLKILLGCLSCQRTGKCVINDDVRQYLEKISNAAILVFATPKYCYIIGFQLYSFKRKNRIIHGKH